ncbi:hypothetical protein BH18ACT1_BH18ACT1_09330 [soil metagenome]
MAGRPLPIPQVLTVLEEGPPRIAALTADLAPARLRMATEDGGWSANGVLAHLRACADVWGHCMAAMLAEDTPTLRAANPTTRIEETDYLDLEFGPSLQAFAAQRAELLALLEPLPQAGWSRAATVTGAGKPLRRTVLFYAQWLARHERTHDKQVDRIVREMRR